MDHHGLASYASLLKRSIDDPVWFWSAVDRDLDLEWIRPYDAVLDLSGGPQWPRWFAGGNFNWVQNGLDRHATGARSSERAIIWVGDDGDERWLTYYELYEHVNRFALGLRELGVTKGDRVGLFLPMIPETVVALMACGKIGAVAIPMFSGYGADAVSMRLNDAQAKVLITASGFPRRGKIVPMKATADAAVAQCHSIERVIVVKRTSDEIPWTHDRDVWFEVVGQGKPTVLACLDTAADDPAMIIYTSGTTGRPKGALHVHAGFPVKAAQDMVFCFDVQAGDCLFWLSDIGWMMGPWAIMGASIIGATILLFEGTPDHPWPDRLWDIATRHKVTHLGIAPTVVRSLMTRGDNWVTKHDLSHLLVLGSSGEPWNLGPWLWYFNVVGGGRLPIINYSGGTEISGGILACSTILPQRPMSFSTAVPGMDAAVFDESGSSVLGSVGELVIRKPWVGMTHGFWNDNERYLETYWSRWEGIWAHGDWAAENTAKDPDEVPYWFIAGRSDDTLKVAGKRVGPAEVETAACRHAAVAEAAAIGVPDEVKGEVVTVFAVLRPGIAENDTIRQEIRATVGQHLGKALAPDNVLFVSDLPRTRNAKIMRRVIRARHLGHELGDITSLENPKAVEGIAHAR
jgi:acetyl-CoA synthetase